VASAAVILLASASAEGSEHVSETLTGSLIWVTWPTVIKVAISYGAIGFFHYFFRRKMLAISFDPAQATHIKLWDFVFYATFGIAITSSVQIAGVLMVFSVLVMPAVVAFLYTRTFTAALLVAWAAGTVALLLGIGVSFTFDLTTGPLIVVAFGFIVLVALLFRRRYGVTVADESERGLTVGLLG
jgi:zinc/manganese transport system permease protein